MMSSAQWGQETRPWDRAPLAISFGLGLAMARMSTPEDPENGAQDERTAGVPAGTL